MYKDSITADNGTTVVLNPNNEMLLKIKKRIELNDGFCPCVSEQTPDTKCPCKDVRTTGNCHCNLYKKLLK